MKFLKNYFLAFLILLSFVAFGYTATVRAESGSDDNDDVEEVDDSGNDSDSDMNDSDEDSDDDSNDENESDDSGNDSASDLNDSDEDSSGNLDDDSDEDNSGPGNWKDRPFFPILKKVGDERPGLFPGAIENKIKIEEKDGEFKARMESKSPIAEARMRVGARIEAHSKNFENLKTRILSRVSKMEEQGIDVSLINSAISNLETKLDDANTAHEELKDLFESDTADKASVEAAAEKIKTSMLEVHEAFKAVVEAMKEAIASSGGIQPAN